MNITNNELRAMLAKMLPETVYLYSNPSTKMRTLFWKEIGSPRAVLDTELLYIVSLVEAESGLNSYPLREKYLYKLMDIVKDDGRDTLVIFATWQQRTRALAEVKGVTL